MFFRLYIRFFLLSVTVAASSKIYTKDEAYKEMAQNIAYFINTFVIKNSRQLDVLNVFESKSQGRLHKDIINVILQQLNSSKVSLSGFWEPQSSVLVIIDSYPSFCQAILSTRKDEYDFTGNFFVYLTNYRKSYDEDRQIFEYSFQQNIVNIVLIYEDNNYLPLLTYFPFPEYQNPKYNECFNINPRHICVYRSEIHTRCDPYPKKLENFGGCMFDVNANVIAPYLYITKNSNGESSLSGYEGIILNILAKELNFHTSIVEPEMTSVPEGIEMRTPAHVSIGRRLKATIHQRNISSSQVYLKSSLILITRSGRYLNYLEGIYCIFSYELWFLYVVIMILAFTLVLVIAKKFPALKDLMLGEGNREPIYWVFITAMGGSVTYRPHRNFARYMLMHWIVMHFFIRSGYQAFFYKTLDLNWRSYKQKNLDEILAQDYSITSTNEIRQSFEELRSLQERIIVYNGTAIDALKDLENSDAQAAVIVSEEIFASYQRLNVQTQLSQIAEPFLDQLICLNFPKNSYLKDRINDILTQLKVSGLVEHFRKVFIPEPSKQNRRRENQHIKVRIKDFYGHLHFFLMWMTASLLLFCLEIASLKVQFLRKMFA